MYAGVDKVAGNGLFVIPSAPGGDLRFALGMLLLVILLGGAIMLAVMEVKAKIEESKAKASDHVQRQFIDSMSVLFNVSKLMDLASKQTPPDQGGYGSAREYVMNGVAGGYQPSMQSLPVALGDGKRESKVSFGSVAGWVVAALMFGVVLGFML